MTTAYINWSNITDMANLPAAANTATGGSFWVGMLYMIWIILLLLLVIYGFETAILTSSFLALILGLLLVFSGLVSWVAVMPFIAIIIIIFLYITYQRNKT